MSRPRGHLMVLQWVVVLQKNQVFKFQHRTAEWISRSFSIRKLSYRKDDRAVRPIYGCPENFQESPSMPTATVSEIFNGLLFRSIP